MIFSEIIFESVPKEKLYKNRMSGLNDPTIPDFNFLTFSSLFKKELKNNSVQKEFINSYLESAKILSRELENIQNRNSNILKIFYSHSLTLPIIYLCRHSIELSIKYAIYILGKKPKYIHSLEKLWSSFMSNLPKEKLNEEKILLKDMTKFVNDINFIDEKGTNLRYALDGDGTCTQEKPIWINSKLIVSTTEKFIKQLEVLNLENIRRYD